MVTNIGFDMITQGCKTLSFHVNLPMELDID